MDVIGAGLQIIEVIEVIRGVYVRVKGLGKEVEDAMADCMNMQGDVEALKKLFNKQSPTKFPKQVAIIVQEFKSLHRSLKKLRKLFKEYEKISQKLFGKFAWAYSKPRATILEMREDFASYRGIFQKALLILNEGHNQDQAKALKELKDQADRARKDMNNRIKALDKKADERSKKDREIYMKKIDELVKMNQATEENRSKVLERWLVEAKGANMEDAKSCASTALKEGKVPSLKTENKPSPKKVEKEKKPPERNGNADESKSTEKAKKVEISRAAAKKPVAKEGNKVQNGNPRPEQKLEPQKVKALSSTYFPKANSPEDKKKPEPEKPVNALAKKVHFEPPKSEKDKGKSPEVKKAQNVPPKAEQKKEFKPAPKKVFPNSEKEKTPELDLKSVPLPRKPKLPVIVIQETNTKDRSTNDKDKRLSPSPSPWSSSSSSSTIAVVGREKPRAASVSSGSSARSQRERIEKNVRYVKGDRRARSQEPPHNLAVLSFE